MNDKKLMVSKNLKMLREAADYKQQEVADFLEIDRGAYANYESGNREMPLNMLQMICEKYGISMSILFESDAALLEKDMICAFRKIKLSAEDLKEVNYFKSVVRNYLKMTKLSSDEVEC